MVERDTVIDVGRFCRSTGIPVDEAYRLLADDRTRTVLSVLCEAERAISLEALADAVAAYDGESPADREFDRDRDDEPIRLWLVHAVLPKLESHGLVTCERDGADLTVERSRDRLETLAEGATSTSQSPS